MKFRMVEDIYNQEKKDAENKV